MVLSGLTMSELYSFKTCLLNFKKDKSFQQMNEGDILDFVDKMLEIFGSKPFSFYKKQVSSHEKRMISFLFK